MTTCQLGWGLECAHCQLYVSMYVCVYVCVYICNLGDEEDNLHGIVCTGIGRLSLSQLIGSDANRPNVRTAVVAGLRDHLKQLRKWYIRSAVYRTNSNCTSGAIQKGVTTLVCLLFIVSVNCPVTPKSANLIAPEAETNIFPALMSRWIFLSPCKYTNAWSTLKEWVGIRNYKIWGAPKVAPLKYKRYCVHLGGQTVW